MQTDVDKIRLVQAILGTSVFWMNIFLKLSEDEDGKLPSRQCLNTEEMSPTALQIGESVSG